MEQAGELLVVVCSSSFKEDDVDTALLSTVSAGDREANRIRAIIEAFDGWTPAQGAYTAKDVAKLRLLAETVCNRVVGAELWLEVTNERIEQMADAMRNYAIDLANEKKNWKGCRKILLQVQSLPLNDIYAEKLRTDLATLRKNEQADRHAQNQAGTQGRPKPSRVSRNEYFPPQQTSSSTHAYGNLSEWFRDYQGYLGAALITLILLVVLVSDKNKNVDASSSGTSKSLSATVSNTVTPTPRMPASDMLVKATASTAANVPVLKSEHILRTDNIHAVASTATNVPVIRAERLPAPAFISVVQEDRNAERREQLRSEEKELTQLIDADNDALSPMKEKIALARTALDESKSNIDHMHQLLEGTKTDIEAERLTLDHSDEQMISNFNAKVAQYEVDKTAYNAKVDQYESDRHNFNDTINIYNEGIHRVNEEVRKLNKIVHSLQELEK